MKGRRWRVAMTMAAIATASTLHAQGAIEIGRQVTARLTMVGGDVSILRDGAHDLEEALVYSRLYVGDCVATGDQGRAEVAIGLGVLLRLDEHSEARFAELTSRSVRIQLHTGLAQLIRQKGASTQIEIETPAVTFLLRDKGDYRFQGDPEHEWILTVRKGRAEVISPQGSVTVQKKELIRVRGTETREYAILKAPKKDEWDSSNSFRARPLALPSCDNWCEIPPVIWPGESEDPE